MRSARRLRDENKKLRSRKTVSSRQNPACDKQAESGATKQEALLSRFGSLSEIER